MSIPKKEIDEALLGKTHPQLKRLWRTARKALRKKERAEYARAFLQPDYTNGSPHPDR